MKKFIEEFKAFAIKGNVIDMAVGVIIGNAFGKIVTSLVNDVVMPLIGIILGGFNFSELTFSIGNANIQYGLFIQNVVDFLIIAICVFMFVKLMSYLSSFRKHNEEEEKEEESEEQKKADDVLLLEEIRDLLKNKNT